ncbi:MAG: cytidylate kinase-like family protein [Hornefia sp.]|nr:cytidylate kinase-like family protein [Hornefia sp.]
MNKNRILISISREFGSGGHEIGKIIGNKLGIPVYDADLLRKVCEEYGYDYDEWKNFEETPRSLFLTRAFGEFSSVPQDHIAEMEFRYIGKKIEEGKSFVIVGRCGSKMIKEHAPAVRAFVWADEDFKIKRIMKRHNVENDEAFQMMKKKDRGRRMYTERFSEGRWDDPKNYDVYINSGKLGIHATAKLLLEYVELG